MTQEDSELRIKINETKDKTRLVLCSKCENETYHIVLSSVNASADVHYGDITFWNDYEILQCKGCETISFREMRRNTEDIEYRADDQYLVEHVTLYPARKPGKKLSEEDRWLLPPRVLNVYKETESALVADMPILAGIGIRALVEAVCKEKSAQGSSLKNRIDNLVAQGVLTSDGAEILHLTRSMGNDAAHEAKPHTDSELLTAMQVVEHLLIGTYIIKKKSEHLPRRDNAT